MVVHRCACPHCGSTHTISTSSIPGGAVFTLGAAVSRKNPTVGAAIAALGIIFSRQLDQFFRYRCPRCGEALSILAQLA